MEEKESSASVSAVRLLSSLYAGQILGVLVTAITFITVTRLLGPSSFGLYTFAFGFSALIDAVGNFGMGSYFGKHLAKYTFEKDPKNLMKTLASGYSVLLPITLILSLLGIALSGYVANSLFPNVGIKPITLMLASAVIFFSTMVSSSVQAMIGFGRGKIASAIQLIVDIVQLISCVSLILLGFGVNGAISGMLIGYVFGGALGIYLSFRTARRYGEAEFKVPAKADLQYTIKYTAPLAANSVLNLSIQNFSILYLGLFVTTSQLGNYGAALRGLNFIAIAYYTMSTALLPLFSRAKAEKKAGEVKETYNRMLFYSMLITLPAVIYVGVLAQPGVHLLLSNNYSNTALFLSLIAFGTILDLPQYYINSLIMAEGFTKKILKYNLLSIIVQYISVIILVPAIGVIGAILAVFFIGGVIDDFLAFKMAKNLLNMKLEYRKMILLFALNLVLGIPIAAALFIPHSALELIAGVVAILVFYPILLAFSKIINKNDVEFIRKTGEKVRFLKIPVDLMTDYASTLIGLRG